MISQQTLEPRNHERVGLLMKRRVDLSMTSTKAVVSSTLATSVGSLLESSTRRFCRHAARGPRNVTNQASNVYTGVSYLFNRKVASGRITSSMPADLQATQSRLPGHSRDLEEMECHESRLHQHGKGGNVDAILIRSQSGGSYPKWTNDRAWSGIPPDWGNFESGSRGSKRRPSQLRFPGTIS